MLSFLQLYTNVIPKNFLYILKVLSNYVNNNKCWMWVLMLGIKYKKVYIHCKYIDGLLYTGTGTNYIEIILYTVL